MKYIVLNCLFFLFLTNTFAQDLDSIMRSLEKEGKNQVVQTTFSSPKLVLLQTNEVQAKNTLTFWVGHRFGDIGGEFGGARTLFGLDNASDIHLGFDYGITDRFTVGIGRSRFNETYNLQGKYVLLQQIPERIPVTLTAFIQSSWITRREYEENEFSSEGDRISHFLQLIIAKKISNSLSLMLNPGYLLRSQVTDDFDEENLFVLGMGGRFKISKQLAIIADYTWVNGLSRPENTVYTNPLGLGLEIETGGHVFSLNFQNATYITENNFIPFTAKSWKDGEVRFGFSISRNFYLGKKEENITEY